MRFLPIDIKENQLNRMDVFLKRNRLDSRGIIYGKVLDADYCSPIGRSEVFLVDTEDILYARTFTNDNGQYLIYDIEPGEYYICTYHPQYEEGLRSLYKIEEGSKIAHNFTLIYNQLSNHSINGKVLKSGNIPASQVPVFLFKVIQDCEELMEIQISNDKGLFYFDDLEDGVYIVKAKISDKINFLARYSLWND